MFKFQNLIEVILSKKNKNDRGVIFINDINEEKYFTYGEIYSRAIEMLKKLKYSGVNEKDEVVLQLSDDLEFISVFWACILGKMVPVPLPTNNNKENNNKIFRVLDNLKSPVLVSNSDRIKQINKKCEMIITDGRWICVNIDTSIDENYRNKFNNFNEFVEDINQYILECKEDDTAFIQFSSGSTGQPKGVIITHKNILSNMKGMVKDSKICDSDILLSWVPLTHNLGLIVSHMLAMIVHLNAYIMNTDLFLYYPYLWLEKVSEHKATLTCSPNFGYKHYLNYIKYKEPKGLDLSNLRLIIDGAEPISKEICLQFVDTLQMYGLNKNVFQTAYGLAEATVSVTSTLPGEELNVITIDGSNQSIGDKVIYLNKVNESKYALELISVGYPHFNNEVRIVDNDNVDLGEDVFGNIQVKGPITTKGYYDVKDETDLLLSKDGWLNTGDIGFIKEKQLVICGRKKDVIFINGKNFYSNDLEKMLYKYDDTKEYLVIGVYNSKISRDQIIAFIKEDITLEEFAKISLNIKKNIMSQSGIKLDYVLPVDSIPKTTSGKIQRFKLIDEYAKGTFKDTIEQIETFEEMIGSTQSTKQDTKVIHNNTVQTKFTRNEVISNIQKNLRTIIGFHVDDLSESLLNYGINSLKVAQFNMLLQETFGKEIPAATVFDYPTINELADFIMDRDVEEEEFTKKHNEKDRISKDDIAIIGVECKFPNGANDISTYWKKLLDGYDAITEIPENREYIYKYFKQKNQINYGGFLDDIEMFSPQSFGITPVEARKLDPQQRLLLEVTYEALQNAGCDIGQTKGSNTGVFIGISGSDYKVIMNKEIDLEQIDNYMVTGNMSSMAAGRIGYVFDWHGPMMAIDTACSSTLVAIHQAVASLHRGECNMAIVGGVNVILSPEGFIGLKKMNSLAPDGKCKAFDDSANGYVRSEGCGVVVLKRYQEAVDSNDNILAVIKGTAINHDGRSSGLIAPNGIAQTNLVKKAILDSGINMDDISYIETHGTGTKLGDPQEINALSKVFTNKSNKILIGSVKSNIGHTETASGIASLIKAVIAIKTGIIPKNIHFETPNKLIRWDDIPFEVNDKNHIWDNSKKMRTAGVSTYGLSGTNAFIILQEAPKESREIPQVLENNINVFTVSARSKELLREDLIYYREFLSITNESLEDICYSTNRGRAYEKYKIAILEKTKEKIVKRIDNYLDGIDTIDELVAKERKVVYIFSGSDSFQVGMGKKLYTSNLVFRNAISECNNICQKYFEKPMTELLYADGGQEEKLKLQNIFPIVVAVEYGLLKVLDSYGIQPESVIGYEVGEYMAAYKANVISLEDALYLAYEEGKMKENQINNCNTIEVFAEEMQVRKLMNEPNCKNISIISINTDDNILLCSAEEEMKLLEQLLNKKGWKYRGRKEYNCVTFSKMNEKIAEFEKIVSEVKFAEPKIPVVCILDRKKYEITDEKYWSSRLTSTINFNESIYELGSMGNEVFVEVGNDAFLSTHVSEILGSNYKVSTSMIGNIRDNNEQVGDTLAQLYESGVAIDWYMNHRRSRKLITLPKRNKKQKTYWFK